MNRHFEVICIGERESLGDELTTDMETLVSGEDGENVEVPEK